MFGSWAGGLGEFGVVFDSSGAEEECVSAVAVVKEQMFSKNRLMFSKGREFDKHY